MKFFISSVIRGFEQYRAAAREAVEQLRYEALLAESRPASESSPQRACLEDVRAADVVIVLLGARYGAKQASGLSATHEEYREARDRCAVLAFVQGGVQPEPDQASFIKEVQSWAGGKLTATFTTPAELNRQVLQAVHEHAVRAERVTPDEDSLRARALALLPGGDRSTEARIGLSIAAGPQQEVIRPKHLPSPELARELQQLALFGPAPVLVVEGGIATAVHGDQLRLQQPNRVVCLAQDGGLFIDLPVQAPQRRDLPGTYLGVVVEDVEDALDLAFRFAARVYDHIDPQGRITHAVPVALLRNCGHLGWRKRSDPPSQAVQILHFGRDRLLAALNPAVRRRPALEQQSRSMAEDLVAILHRGGEA